MNPERRTLFWIWLMMVVAYLDRTNITIAGPALRASLHIGHTAFGYVLSAFTLGYALMQVPGGLLADRLGAKRILVAALILWSIFTALTGLAWSLISLIAIRILFGFAEGLENGAQFKLIGDTFDTRQRSLANAIFLSALAVGPALGAPITAKLVVLLGWRSVFAVFAVLGLIVAGLLALFLPNRSARDGETPMAAGTTQARAGASETLRGIRPWLAFGAYGFFNIAFWGFIGWMPSYLSEARHITIEKLGAVSSIPYCCGFVGMVLLGRLGEKRLYAWRAAAVGVAYLLAALFLTVTFRAVHLTQCLFGLSAAAFFLYGGFGPFWAVAMDLIPGELRGALTGFVNLGGQIGGFIAPIAVGYLVTNTGSYTTGFIFMSGGLVLSSLCLFGLQIQRSLPRSLRVANGADEQERS